MNIQFKNIIAFAFVSLFLFACDSTPSLQKYYVEKLDDAAFVVVNLPLQLNQIFGNNLTETEQKTVAGIEKFNLLFLRKQEEKIEYYNSELNRIQNILKQNRYQHLMDFKAFDNAQGNIMYEGDDVDRVKEGIVFFHSQKMGFAVLRIIGPEINPAGFMGLINKIDAKQLEQQMKNTVSIFNNSL